jgi:hypothetical protein
MTNNRHTVNPNGPELLSFIQLFPNVEDLAITCALNLAQTQPICLLNPTGESIDGPPHLRRLQILLQPYYEREVDGRFFEEAMPQLVALFQHLPLRNLPHLGIFLEDLIDADYTRVCFSRLIAAMKAMRFEELESFHLGFVLDSHNLPSEDLWVSS